MNPTALVILLFCHVLSVCCSPSTSVGTFPTHTHAHTHITHTHTHKLSYFHFSSEKVDTVVLILWLETVSGRVMAWLCLCASGWAESWMTTLKAARLPWCGIASLSPHWPHVESQCGSFSTGWSFTHQLSFSAKHTLAKWFAKGIARKNEVIIWGGFCVAALTKWCSLYEQGYHF